MGCSEHLDPRFASKYIQPCPSSCIVFRNPTDHNCKAVLFFKRIKIWIWILVITRDCASAWPDVHAKSGLHKVLGSDAFFCQESLYANTNYSKQTFLFSHFRCNGIGFDFIMGKLFHNISLSINFFFFFCRYISQSITSSDHFSSYWINRRSFNNSS